ncbi:hypothetical protein WHR41_09422 [Cladosporium halotolerans]|uniref:non-specific serine/threonine protein kinase n=1 Tax=Cladosporium halotolerans TaxID=1052096 RepID=A0AB34KES0_9PEZI
MQCLHPLARSVASKSRLRTSFRDVLGLTHRYLHTGVPMAKSAGFATCELDAEPLHRYRAGGYHPLHLGDRLKAGRYEVLHKLGWGGYATVWLGKDHDLGLPVAMKVIVSELCDENHEASMYHHVSCGPPEHPGRDKLPQMLDSFTFEGPNGVHQCLILELLGASMSSMFEKYETNRLPSGLAWDVARQVVQATSYMHDMGIVHGDLHPGNIALLNPAILGKSAEEIVASMDAPATADVRASDGERLTNHLPQYLVLPSAIPQPKSLTDCKVKVIDLGSAFLSDHHPSTMRMRCPLPYRAPEAVITSQWDKEADIWSLGCTIFALIVGYPPFDSFLFKEQELVSQWIGTFGELPSEWQGYSTLQDIDQAELDVGSLTDWLRETYYDDDRPPSLTDTDLERVGGLLLRLLQYRPSDRPSAGEILLDPLFHPHTFRVDNLARQ